MGNDKGRHHVLRRAARAALSPGLSWAAGVRGTFWRRALAPDCKRQDTAAQLFKPVRHYLKHHRHLLMGEGPAQALPARKFLSPSLWLAR
ncbi:hypothetical protein PATSB16_16080 [Pandoraea thiooxydans]|nr:hypothetical protein PATSB16_16080 [Pandoraea thiooxydans]